MLKSKTILSAVLTLALISVITAPAQEVSIPDPGLNAAIRQTLQKPTGPLTQQDLLGLTSLTADDQNITNIAGLEAARNLVTLSLQSNHLANLSIPGGLTNLITVDLSANQLASLTLSSNLTELESLQLENNRLTSFTLSSNLVGRMFFLDLSFNMLTNCALPGGMTNLDTLSLEANRLTNFTLPSESEQVEQSRSRFQSSAEPQLARGFDRIGKSLAPCQSIDRPDDPCRHDELEFSRH